jgi:ATP-binding cassette, subfamily B, bacterial MsbA
MKKPLNLPLSYHSNEKKGDLISRMTSDVQLIEHSVISSLEMIFREPITIIAVFWERLLIISPQLTTGSVGTVASERIDYWSYWQNTAIYSTERTK